MKFLVPFAAVSTVAFASDTAAARNVSTDATFNSRARRVSDVGLFAATATSGGLFLLGKIKSDDHASEAGLLAGEAAVNALAIGTVAKYAFGRERPGEGSGRGEFFQGGNSFPSGHAVLTWSMATVLAHEYPGWGTKALAYGTAAAVSFGRVYGRKHFPSDDLIGSAVGWLVGREVYRLHHDPNLEGATLGTFRKSPAEPRELPDYGSSYVPVDSWIYPALDRLAALGYIHSAYSGIRPWTRAECARLVHEAASMMESDNGAPESSIYEELKEEFATESGGLTAAIPGDAQVESFYLRTLGISGTTLNDSFHFGQTIVNDYGRPYAGGWNQVAGTSARASSGPFALYFRGEYQHAPALPIYPADVQATLASVDSLPNSPANLHFGSADRFTLLEGYAAFNFKSLQVTAGKQDLWWGPGEGSPLMFSNNAEPIYMLRVTKTSPWHIPGLSSVLGPAQLDLFLGRLEQHQYPAKPYIHGQKVTFHPTRNLELGFSRTVMFAGEGHPLTLASFWKSFISVGDVVSSTPGVVHDVGDRRGGFDFTYRVPGLRNWLQLYGDFMSEDDPSPLAAPQRSIWRPGFYLSRLPKFRGMDLRVEAQHSASSSLADRGGSFFYTNTSYKDGYTNRGQILGSWIGRRATGVEAWSRYWLGAQSNVGAHFRRAQVDRTFIPGGARLTEISMNGEKRLNNEVSFSATVGYVSYAAPLLAATPQNNAIASVQLTYRPAWRWNRASGN